MSVTFATLKQRVAEEVGGYLSFSTTSAGDTGGETLVSTNLMEFVDGALKEKWVQNSTGTIEIRKIENNFSPSGTVKVYRPFAATVATSLAMELFDYSPNDLTSYINHAIRDAYPALAKEVHDTNMVGKNVLSNSNFEEWAAGTSVAPTNWTASVSSVAQEPTTKLFGSYSMKVHTAAGSVYLSSDTVPELRQFEDSTVSWYCWVNTAAATNARIYVYTLTTAGTPATTYSSYHTGGSEWELLELEGVSVPDDLAEIRFGCAIATTTTAYFDNGYCTGKIEDYPLPSSVDRVMGVYQCNDADELIVDGWEKLDWEIIDKSGTKYLRIPDVSAKKKMEIVGYATYTALSAYTDTIDLTTEWQRAIVCGATAALLRANSVSISSNNISEVLKLADKYQNEFEMLKARSGKSLSYRMKKWGS